MKVMSNLCSWKYSLALSLADEMLLLDVYTAHLTVMLIVSMLHFLLLWMLLMMKVNYVFYLGILISIFFKVKAMLQQLIFLNVLFSSYFHPLICKPTRVTNKTATLIDNIFTNSFDYESNSGILCTDISDHFPIFNLNLGISGSSRMFADKPSYRKFSEMNIDRFKSMIEHTTWDDIYIQHDAELAHQLFFSNI